MGITSKRGMSNKSSMRSITPLTSPLLNNIKMFDIDSDADIMEWSVLMGDYIYNRTIKKSKKIYVLVSQIVKRNAQRGDTIMCNVMQRGHSFMCSVHNSMCRVYNKIRRKRTLSIVLNVGNEGYRVKNG